MASAVHLVTSACPFDTVLHARMTAEARRKTTQARLRAEAAACAPGLPSSPVAPLLASDAAISVPIPL